MPRLREYIYTDDTCMLIFLHAGTGVCACISFTLGLVLWCRYPTAMHLTFNELL